MDHQNMEKNTVVEVAVQVCNGPATGNGQDTHSQDRQLTEPRRSSRVKKPPFWYKNYIIMNY